MEQLGRIRTTTRRNKAYPKAQMFLAQMKTLKEEEGAKKTESWHEYEEGPGRMRTTTRRNKAYLKTQMFWALMKTLKEEERARMGSRQELERTELRKQGQGSANRSGVRPRKTLCRSH